MDSVCKRVILLIVLGAALLGPMTARAASYQDALDDYSEQKFSRSYKKAMSLAREKRGTRRGKALMLAAAAVLEMDREQKARALFKRALDEDPDLDLPDVVRSRRAQRFFADVREGRGSRIVVARAAFDRPETYLPFGLNQLLQGKIFLGLTLGSAQGLGLYFAYSKNQDAKKAEQETASLRRRAIQTGDDINPVFLELVAGNQAFIRRSKQVAQLSLGVTALAYGTSVLEAGYRAPSRSSVALQPLSTYPLVSTSFHDKHLQLELLNPLLSVQGFQLSLQF
ncbi:MAG TPA: hypothetical protein VFO10_26175 [Oligoflexus sp.]|uniref:hypothetical protein n=1 Tax=Oligoflexus sp. TaxID=1971216 RepID=UPI002D7FD5B3|nr:hypothetical protein [Oligoflexus sp.]HET9240779.1 hypothetical protein [Oligoflexus sp.]